MRHEYILFTYHLLFSVHETIVELPKVAIKVIVLQNIIYFLHIYEKINCLRCFPIQALARKVILAVLCQEITHHYLSSDARILSKLSSQPAGVQRTVKVLRGTTFNTLKIPTIVKSAILNTQEPTPTQEIWKSSHHHESVLLLYNTLTTPNIFQSSHIHFTLISPQRNIFS